jgi:hypothetical protein
MMEHVAMHIQARLEVFFHRPPHYPYEAHITMDDGYQRRGYGDTPREAIIDALAELPESEKPS